MEGKITLSPTEISLEDNDTVRRASDGVSRKRYLKTSNIKRRTYFIDFNLLKEPLRSPLQRLETGT